MSAIDLDKEAMDVFRRLIHGFCAGCGRAENTVLCTIELRIGHLAFSLCASCLCTGPAANPDSFLISHDMAAILRGNNSLRRMATRPTVH